MLLMPSQTAAVVEAAQTVVVDTVAVWRLRLTMHGAVPRTPASPPTELLSPSLSYCAWDGCAAIHDSPHK